MKTRTLILAFASCGILSFGLAQKSHADLIANGNFDTTSGLGQVGYNTTVSGWTTSGYDNHGYAFLFGSGTADTTGVTGQYGNLQLWGPNSPGGFANGLPATSPAGGNFIGADGSSGYPSTISQTISGLSVGSKYAVSFYWAGAQQYNFTGITTEQWQVTLGSQVFSTAVVTNVSHGFTGWQQQTFVYTATSTSEVLSFLAIGTPDGVPPFSLLDGPSMVAVPEPTTIVAGALMIIPFGVSTARILRRKAKA
jgi:hypothetical protein